MDEEGSLDSVDKYIKRTHIKHTVDEDTVMIGKGTKKVSQKDTNRMLEEKLDQLPQGSEERKVYEKIWDGNRKYN